MVEHLDSAGQAVMAMGSESGSFALKGAFDRLSLLYHFPTFRRHVVGDSRRESSVRVVVAGELRVDFFKVQAACMITVLVFLGQNAHFFVDYSISVGRGLFSYLENS